MICDKCGYYKLICPVCGKDSFNLINKITGTLISLKCADKKKCKWSWNVKDALCPKCGKERNSGIREWSYEISQRFNLDIDSDE